MSEQNLNQGAVEVAAKRFYGRHGKGAWDASWERLHPRVRAEYCTQIEDFVGSYMSALPAQPDTVNNVRGLHLLDAGTVVRAEGGSIWKKFNRGMGVWFKVGDSLDYEASVIPLPATVLYRPAVNS